jgi:S1-C subfamily serine protease
MTVWYSVAAIAVLLGTLVTTPAAAHSLAGIYERVSPSIVTVYSAERIKEGEPPRWVQRADQGSGVIVDSKGQILTAAHLVQSADQVMVEFHTGVQSMARVVSSEPAVDIALLLPATLPSSARPAALGDSAKTRIGDEIALIGAPLDIARILTVGHVSGRIPESSDNPALFPAELFLTDAVITRGSSGSAMFDDRGALIGIVTHVIHKDGVPCGLGCAVTINAARKWLIDQPPFWSGLVGHLLTGNTAKAFQLPQSGGVLVQRIAAGSPAGNIGLRAGTRETTIGTQSLMTGGDIILTVDEIALTDFAAYQAARERARTLKAGNTVSIGILRDGERVTLKYTVPAEGE